MKRLVALAAVAGLAVALAAVAGAEHDRVPAGDDAGQAGHRVRRPGGQLRQRQDPRLELHQPEGLRGRPGRSDRQGSRPDSRVRLHAVGEAVRPGHKTFDISFQEATITAQRKKTVDFTSSYFDANQGVLLSKKAPVPHSLADLKKLQTCAQTDTTGLDYIQQKLHPDKAPLIYQSTAAAFVAVQIGRCDALVLDTPIVASEKKARPSPLRHRRRPDHHARAVRRRTGQGLGADADRRQPDQEALGERHDRQAAEEVVQRRLLEDPGPEVVT